MSSEVVLVAPIGLDQQQMDISNVARVNRVINIIISPIVEECKQQMSL